MCFVFGANKNMKCLRYLHAYRCAVTGNCKKINNDVRYYVPANNDEQPKCCDHCGNSVKLWCHCADCEDGPCYIYFYGENFPYNLPVRRDKYGVILAEDFECKCCCCCQ